MSTLIETPARPTALSGTGLGDSAGNVLADLTGGQNTNFLDLAGDAASFGLDALSFASNPLKGLVQAGLGWLMDHWDFLREPIEWLTGDARAVQACAASYSNIANALASALTTHNDALAGLASWRGEAAESYKDFSYQFGQTLEALMLMADSTSQGIAIAGAIVGTFRGIVMDLIAEFITWVIGEILMAIASALVTLGGSIAAAVIAGDIAAGVTASRVSAKVAELLSTMSTWVSKLGKLGEILLKIGRVLLKMQASKIGSHVLDAASNANKGASDAWDTAGRPGERPHATGDPRTYLNPAPPR